MATGQPGFGDSLFKLATQRQTALRNEQIRKRNEDTLRRSDINTLSGFDAASIEGDQQRSIFEEAVADVQSYITGTGEYEDATYDPINFRKHLNKIKSLYNGFKAHNAGDVKSRKDALNTDAYTAGGVDQEGGSLGIRIKTNNTPSSYNQAVSDHNNYFEAAKTPDGRAMFDENGHPMGYPVIDGEVDRTAAPVSLFKMNAYANPESFRGNTVEVAIPTTLDYVQESTNKNSLNLLKSGLTGDDLYTLNDSGQRTSQRDARGLHDRAVTKFFDDKWTAEGKSEFRETLLVDMKKEEGGEFLTPEQEQAFVNGDFSNIRDEHMKQLRERSEKIYADRSWENVAPEEGETDSPYSSVADRGMVGPEDPEGSRQWQVNMLKTPIKLTGTVDSETGEIGGESSIIGTGVNSDGDRVVTLSKTETVPDLSEGAEAGSTMEVTRREDVVVKPGDQHYETLAMQDDKRLVGDLDKQWRERGLEIEQAEIKKEEEKAAAIQVIKDANPGITDAKAQKILDAGGQDAYDLQQKKTELQPKIDEARKLLVGDEGGGIDIPGLDVPELEKAQLLKDLDSDELASEQTMRVEKPDGSVVLEQKYPSAPEGATVAEMAMNRIQMLATTQPAKKAAEAKKAQKEEEIERSRLKAWGELEADKKDVWKTNEKSSHGPEMKTHTKTALNEAYNGELSGSELEKIVESDEFQEILVGEGIVSIDAVGPVWLQKLTEKLGQGSYPRIKESLNTVIDKYKEQYGDPAPAGDVDPVVTGETQELLEEQQEERRLAELKEDIKAEEADEAEALDESSADVDELVKEQFTNEVQSKTPEIVNTAASVNTENVDVNSSPEEQAVQMLTDTLNLNVPEAEMEEEIYEMFTNVIGPDTTASFFNKAVKHQNLKGNPDVVPSWCAVYVSDLLLKADPDFKLEEGYARVRAKTFLDVGEEVSMENNFNDAKLGDIVVKKGLEGYHVGLFAGIDENGDIKIFGANQNDSINVTSYPAQEIQGVRRVEARLLSENQLEAISTITNANKNATT